MTLSEYVSAIQQVANDYGITVDAYDYEESATFTEEMLEQEIHAVKEFGTILNETNGLQIIGEPDYISRVIPSKATFTKDFSINQYGYGNAGFRLTLNVTLDLQNAAVISVDGKSVVQYGSYSNLKSYNVKSIHAIPNNPYNGDINTTVVLQVTFEKPSGNGTMGYTGEYTRSFIIQAQ